MITLFLANRRGGPAALNVYQYVQAVYVLPYAVLAVPLATSAFPRLAAARRWGGRRGGTPPRWPARPAWWCWRR